MGTEESVGAKLRRLRKARNMTMDELADQVGVSRPTIWSWESDKSIPRASRIRALAQSFNVSENELILSDAPTRQENAATLDEEIARSKARIANLAGTSPENVEITIKF